MNFLPTILTAQHPATRTLLRRQRLAKIQRVIHGFRSPRRLLLSMIATLLTILWIGQTVAGVFLREAADPAQLLNWLTLGLSSYTVWNVLKVVFRKPVEPFEWTTAEKEWLLGAPLSRKELVRYRISNISTAVLVKAAIFTLVLIPDLHFLPFAFFGAYVGLLAIELIRTALEIVVYGMTSKERFVLRSLVAALTLLAMAQVGVWYHAQWTAGQFSEFFSVEFIKCTLAGLQMLPDTPIGKIICLPFGVLASVIVAHTVSLSVACKITFGGLVLVLLRRALERIDTSVSARLKKFERSRWPDAMAADRVTRSMIDTTARLNVCKIPSLGGMGSLIWRQLLGVNRYRTAVAVSLVAPSILALVPAFGDESGRSMVGQIMILIACYSFLLLPAALKFDFRRDLDRINVLKALPMKPLTIATGQLAVPVVITSVFQLFALLLAMMINPFHPSLLLVAMVLLVPTNVFIFALENLMFLLYPYRLSEEGIQVFLRAILAFTAKGILMAIGLGLAFTCLLLSIVAGKYFSSPELASMAIFAVISGGSISLVSALVVLLLARTFNKLDPSQDLATVQF